MADARWLGLLSAVCSTPTLSSARQPVSPSARQPVSPGIPAAIALAPRRA
jgi:hypothetical protein